MYFTSKDCKYLVVDVDNYELFDDDYEFFDDDYGNYGYNYDDDNYYDNDYYDDYLYYIKPFNNFESLVFVKNNILNLINNDDNDIKPLLSVKHIALSIDNINTFIYESVY